MVFDRRGFVAEHVCTEDAALASATIAARIGPHASILPRIGGNIDFETRLFVDREFMAGIVRFDSNIDIRSINDTDAVVMIQGFEEKVILERNNDAIENAAHGIMMFSLPGETTIKVTSPCSGFVFMISSDYVKKIISDFIGYEISDDFEFMTMIDGRTPSGAALAALSSSLKVSFEDDAMRNYIPTIINQYKDALTKVMIAAGGTDNFKLWTGPSSSRAMEQVLFAENFMRNNLKTIDKVEDIANAVGVSLRLLQYNFKKVRDATPLGVLNNMKIRAARDDILSGEFTSISEVARKWHFNNPSRFSRRYQEMFGERVADTILRANLKVSRS